jgi:bifunctional lysine-specific demethylase and histidyl-hydroxylase NO66
LHLTIGVRLVSWADVLRPLVSAAVDEHRTPLPAGYAVAPESLGAELADRLRAVAATIEKADANELVQRAADRFWSTRPAPLEGQLQQLLAVDAITDTARLRRRPHVRVTLHHDGAKLVVRVTDRELRLPAAAEPAVRLVLERPEVTVSELTPYLDDSSRLVLARRLVREGLVTVADPA